MNIPAIFTGVLRKGVERFDGKDEREFLPAALEILETPPSPTGRGWRASAAIRGMARAVRAAPACKPVRARQGRDRAT